MGPGAPSTLHSAGGLWLRGVTQLLLSGTSHCKKCVGFCVLLFQDSSLSLIPSVRKSIRLLPSPEQVGRFAEGRGKLSACCHNSAASEPREHPKCCSLERQPLGKATNGFKFGSARGATGRCWCLFPRSHSWWSRAALPWGEKFSGDV